ncbi:hypothetical protein B0I72DRAFT_134124 [Yarrowia lipolytica]|jgi:hypothetical protein|uniref:YALI0B06160p n=2 Tax=Yarrowia lipolytica TaxID=4952 RepID=Q6CFK4_YARLI|nr:YALI0B06160p [Yarrowia lipolytica CLIB122]QNP97299.1 Hypothetical protein YALI2_C00952g [Yarrowia lipolytica]RDW22663.1 hypothetical protein B0I71DRAFT_137222 [Yarrowia lipolytica]RDW34824.1 hypothetical protein B0I72DRAFT_134124 [Yarrowia lipolytica]RDW38589.1 hypothetical protein B0I73DRAFT_133511 [Yarrowia lipolytica]RDW43091.1 hypothetical protein B0I74DRAFT_142607 [Yarrowia lipolytica]|eukprot:XP_500558.1 YALI0B06160p [Yarrowia lipolytica CLIB122]
MLFKTFSLLTAASAALAAPVACEQPQEHNEPSHPTYSLHAFMPGQGALGMKALQIRGNDVVYGLEQGYSYFKVEDVGNAMTNVLSEGQGPRQLFADVQTGKLDVKDGPAPPLEGNSGGWAYKGDGSVKELSSYGTREFYSCTSQTDPLHGGQVVYVFNGAYACKEPIKFTIGATKE